MNTENFGKKILSIRQNANLTQEDLALRMGVTSQAVSKWERGQSLPDVPLLAQLCRVLGTSADLLLGLEYRNLTENNDLVIQDEILRNLRKSVTDPIAVIFGNELVPAIVDADYVNLVAEERIALSKEGFLLPLVWLRDSPKLEPKEYVVTIYDRVFHREQIETVDQNTVEYMIHTLEQVARKNYGQLLNRDIVKCLTDNLRNCYPALIDGVIPEKIPYSLLQNVLEIFFARGNSPKYLPRVIEKLESALYTNPDASVEDLANQVCSELETLDNFYVYFSA